jgi:hypothetical protein
LPGRMLSTILSVRRCSPRGEQSDSSNAGNGDDGRGRNYCVRERT